MSIRKIRLQSTLRFIPPILFAGSLFAMGAGGPAAEAQGPSAVPAQTRVQADVSKRAPAGTVAIWVVAH